MHVPKFCEGKLRPNRVFHCRSQLNAIIMPTDFRPGKSKERNSLKFVQWLQRGWVMNFFASTLLFVQSAVVGVSEPNLRGGVEIFIAKFVGFQSIFMGKISYFLE